MTDGHHFRGGGGGGGGGGEGSICCCYPFAFRANVYQNSCYRSKSFSFVSRIGLDCLKRVYVYMYILRHLNKCSLASTFSIIQILCATFSNTVQVKIPAAPRAEGNRSRLLKFIPTHAPV